MTELQKAPAPWEFGIPPGDPQLRANVQKMLCEEWPMEQFEEWHVRYSLHLKIATFYSAHPSHINERFDSGGIVYFAETYDRPSLLLEMEKAGVPYHGPAADRPADEDESTKAIRNEVYQKWKDTSHRYVKIGTTSRGTGRIDEIRTGCPFPVFVTYWFRGSFAEEREMHRIFRGNHVSGEWFMLGPDLKDYLKTMGHHALVHDVSRCHESLERLIG